MFSYLCHTNKFKVNNKGEDIDNIEKFIDFLKVYIQENIIFKTEFPTEVFSLLVQLNDKSTGTIKSDILWVILTDILEVNIKIYIDDNTPANIHNKVIHEFNLKSNENIKIHGNLNHYSSIINSIFNFDNIPSNAKIWYNNMVNINYTGIPTVEEHKEYTKEYTKTFIVKKIDVEQYRLKMKTARDYTNSDKYDVTIIPIDGSKRKSINRKSINRKSIKRNRTSFK